MSTRAEFNQTEIYKRGADQARVALETAQRRAQTTPQTPQTPAMPGTSNE